MTTADKAPKKKAADIACDTVRRAILRGDYAPGATLPGEREFAETLGVSRLTLRTALTRLESEGLVRSEHGSGTRVLDYRESGGLDVLLHLAEMGFADGQPPLDLLREVLELRRMVAVELVGVIAERGTARSFDGLRAHIAGMREAFAAGDRARFVELDLRVARWLVEAGQNLAMELLYNTIERFVTQTPGVSHIYMTEPEPTINAYAALLALLEAGDADAARLGVRTTLSALDVQILAGFDSCREPADATPLTQENA